MGIKGFKEASLEVQEIRSKIGDLEKRIRAIRGYL